MTYFIYFIETIYHYMTFSGTIFVSIFLMQASQKNVSFEEKMKEP